MPRLAGLCALTLGLVVSGVGLHAQTPIPPAPQDFLLAALQGDQYEIVAAQLAEVQGQDPRVRAFAQTMIRDHTRMSQDLRNAGAAAHLASPPPGLSGDQAMLLGGLQGVRGVDFDRAYARQQEIAHAQAAAVVDSFASAGAEPNLRSAAKETLPTIKDHLKMARELRADLGGS